MKNDEILTKAIEKAKHNGFDCFGWKHFQVVVGGVGFWDYDDIDSYAEAAEKGEGHLISNEELLFNHNFAQALWGKFDPEDDERFKLKYIDGEEAMFMGERWQYHLQLIALEKDRIKYLEEFI